MMFFFFENISRRASFLMDFCTACSMLNTTCLPSPDMLAGLYLASVRAAVFW